LEQQHINISKQQEVDDAGLLITSANRTYIAGGTMSCRIRGDEEEQRQETCKVIESITGLGCKAS
jgi:hypothetical protein